MSDLYLSVGAGDAGGGNGHGANCYGSAWESGTSTEGNYSVVSWSISANYYCKSGWTWGGASRPNAGYLDMVVNGSVVGTMTLPINRGWGDGTGIGTISGSLNIGHNADGTGSFSFYIRVRTGSDQNGVGVVYSSRQSGTASKGLSTIPRASQPSASTNSPVAANAFTVYTNRKSSSFTHKIYYEIRYGGANGTHVAVSTSVADSVSVTVPESVFDSATSVSTLTCRILCYTFSGSTQIGDVKYVDLTLHVNPDMAPSLKSLSITELNGNVKAKGASITLRYISRKSISISGTPKHNASIVSIDVWNGNYAQQISGASGTLTFENLQSGSYNYRITDSRGMSTTGVSTQTYYAYEYPTVTGSADRTTTTGSAGKLTLSGTYWNSLSNTASITYKRNTESSSHTLSATPSAGKVRGSVSYSDLNYQTAYSWDVIITDGFGETVRSIVTLPQATPALFIGKNSIWTNSMKVGGSLYIGDTPTVDNFLTSIRNNPACNGSVYFPSGSKIAGVDVADIWWHFYTLVHRTGGPYGDNGNYVYLHLQKMVNNNGTMATRDFWCSGGTWSITVPGYPIGAIYISVNPTSPATLFGGSWTEITGRFLLAHDSSHPAGSTGGEYSHTLTQSEMPRHNHYTNSYADGWPTAVAGQGSYRTLVNSIGTWKKCGNDYSSNEANGIENTGTTNCGNSQPHNNTPPYLSVYMWKRTA